MKPEVLVKTGLEHKNRGNLVAAEQCYRQALQQAPGYLPALGNLAVVLRLAGRQGDAASFLERLVALAPQMPEAHFSLGNVYSDLARHDDAIRVYRRAIELEPRYAEAWVNLGNAHLARRERGDARQCFLRAAQLQPALFEAQLGLAMVANIESSILEGLAAAEKALAILPTHPQAISTYANLLKDIGLGERAVALYRRAAALEPAVLEHFDLLLMALTYLGVPEDEWFEEHLRYGRQRELVEMIPAVTSATRRGREKLRIAYVSGDFRAHSIAYFVWPLIKVHDRTRFEVCGYFTGDAPDRETGLFQARFDHWLDAGKMNDQELAERIRADEIDILIDLSSHSAFGRLGVFARRPAPVQVTWLGYAATTGLSRIDWRLSDAVIDPPGTTERFHSERVFRLPVCSYTFSPSPNCPPSGPLPARRKGGLTLASFSNSAKLSPKTIALWARLLHALPTATLKLFIYGGDDAPIAEHARQMFVQHGIDGARIQPFGKREFFQFMDLHQEVDLALDSLTFSGVTTTLYTLWMGVPVVTLPGLLPITRTSASLLSTLGLGDFIAANETEYIDIVCRAAKNLDQLESLRARLRARLEGSPLLDHAGFARRLEDAYCSMWQSYLDGQSGAETSKNETASS